MDPYVSLHPHPKKSLIRAHLYKSCSSTTLRQPFVWIDDTLSLLISWHISWATKESIAVASLHGSHQKILLQWHWLMFWDVWLMFQLHAVSSAVIAALLYIILYICSKLHLDTKAFWNDTLPYHFAVHVILPQQKRTWMCTVCCEKNKSAIHLATFGYTFLIIL